MSDSDLSKVDPHRTGLFAGFFLGGASIIFGTVAIGIMLFGNTTFDVVEYGLGIESRYVRVLISPVIAFFGGYLFTYTICRGILFLFSRHEEKN